MAQLVQSDGCNHSMSNATFDIEDVTQLLEMGAQSGLDSAEALEKYGNTWDMIADGSGGNAVQLAEAGVALQTMGIGAAETSEALNAFGFITESTTQDIDSFLGEIARVGPDLHDMGVDVDGAAALFGALEHEMGLTGRLARQELNTAINESEGNFEDLLSTLGLTQEQFDEYNLAVQDSSDVLQKNADDMMDAMTPMQHMQSWAADLTYQYGDLINMVAGFAPVLLALGPALKAVTMAKAMLNMTMLMSPITWIIAGFAAVAIAAYLLWDNWEIVSGFLADSWEWLKETAVTIFTTIGDWITEIFQAVGDFLVSAFEWYLEIATTVWTSIFEFTSSILSSIWEFITSIFSSIYETVATWLSNAYNKIVEIWNNASSFTSEILSTIWETITSMFSNFVDTISEWMGNAYDKIVEIWNKAQSFLEDIDLFDIGMNIIQGLIDGIWDMAESLWGTITDVADGIIEKFKEKLWIFSPSRLFEGFGIDTMMGYQIGFEDQAEHVHSLVDDTAKDIGDGFEPDVSTSQYTPERAPVSSSNRQQVVFNDTYNINVEGDADQTTLDMLESRMRELHEELFRKRMEVYNKRMNAKYV